MWRRSLRLLAAQGEGSGAAGSPLVGQRISGTIESWLPVLRRGVVKAADGTTYPITTPAAFETLMPTMLRTIDGAAVTFIPHLVEVKPDEYGEYPETPADPEVIAQHIVIDMDTVTKLSSVSTMPGHHDSSEEGQFGDRGIDQRYLDVPPLKGEKDLRGNVVFSKSKQFHATKQTAMFDKDLMTKAATDAAPSNLPQEDGGRGGGLFSEPAEEQDPNREVIYKKRPGIIVAWSYLHKTGLVVSPKIEGDTQKPGDVHFRHRPSASEADGTTETSPSTEKHEVDESDVRAFIAEEVRELIAEGDETKFDQYFISGVDSFAAALPSAKQLRGSEITFDVACYHDPDGKMQPKIYAEDILIVQAAEGTPLEKPAKFGVKTFTPGETRGGNELRRSWAQDEVEDQKAKENIPKGRVYGVVSRWSGGQGAVEGSNELGYYIDSAHDFKILDPTAVSIRGAVVTFEVDEAEPRYAKRIEIVSEMTTERMKGTRGFSDHQPMPTFTVAQPVLEVDQTRTDLPWIFGRISVFTSAEGHGVISCESDATKVDDADAANGVDNAKKADRFLIRDAVKSIPNFDDLRDKIKKGTRVRFLAGGATNRLALHITLAPLFTTIRDEATGKEMEVEVDEFGDPILPEATAEEDDPEKLVDKGRHSAMEEATGSPMATEYWTKRFEKVGISTSEYTAHKERLKPPEMDEIVDEDETDPWMRDPEKNKVMNENGARWSDLARVSSQGLLKMGMIFQDPQQTEKFKKKIEKRVPEEVKHHAMERAKEAAPYYLKKIREAERRGQDPKFSTM